MFGYTIAELSATTFAQGEGNKYLYNGKELQNDFDLDWYDYGARMYDPVIGRFLSIDPLTEHNYSINPYAYCSNNPTNKIDPTGMEDEDPQSYDIDPDGDGILSTVEVIGHKPSWFGRQWNHFVDF